MLPYSREMMFVDVSLECVVSQRPHLGTLLRLPRPLSLMFPYSRGVMIELSQSLHGVVYVGHVFGLFVPLPPAFLIGSTQEENISMEGAVGQFCFSVLCS